MKRLWATILLVAVAGSAAMIIPQGASEAPAPPRQERSAIGAGADTYVDQTRPRRNLGKAPRLRADAAPVRRTYVRFDVPATDDSILDATLKLYARTGSNRGHDVYLVGNGWKEDRVNYKTAPPAGATPAGSSGGFRSGWTSVDVSRVVDRSGTYSFALTTRGRKGIAYASREARRGPRLVFRSSPGEAPDPPQHRVYAYYYLWWSTRHWHDKLGPNYDYDRSPLPLPATLDSDGCNAESLYDENQLIDVPAALYSQDDPGVIEGHVRAAASAGLSGFIVNWRGTGEPGQTSNSVSYSRRLAEMFRAVDEVSSEGMAFKLWIQYKSSDTMLSAEHIVNDWAYLKENYADHPALDRAYSAKPIIVFGGSRKYPVEVLKTVSEAYRDTFFIVGDESWKTWDEVRGRYLDGNQYYWSSQNPYSNPRSFDQLSDLATKVRLSGPNPDGSRKLWFAPFTPGYNSVLLGGSTCVPRNDGTTMRDLFAGNRRSTPDGWVFISWNEIAEGTFIEPLQRWGWTYLEHLSDLIHSP